MPPTPKPASKPVTKKSGSDVVDGKTTDAAEKANKSGEKAGKAGQSAQSSRRTAAQRRTPEQQKAYGQRKTRTQTRKGLEQTRRAVKALPPPGVGKGHQLFVMAFFASVAVISWQEIKTFKRMPLPSRFIGAGVAFGLLAIVEPLIEDLAGWLAWGLFTGLVYSQFGAGPQNGGKVPAVANVTPPPDITPVSFERSIAPKQGGNTPQSTNGSAANALVNGAGGRIASRRKGQ